MGAERGIREAVRAHPMTLRFGDYVCAEADGDEHLWPLFNCLRFAIETARPLDFYLSGILTGIGPCGGDPGWTLQRRIDEHGKAVFWADMNSDISGEEVDEGTTRRPSNSICVARWKTCARFTRASLPR